MHPSELDGDAGPGLVERRWFASQAAVRLLKAECELLREAMEAAEDAWRRARTELVRLETLRDALGEELIERERRCASRTSSAPPPSEHRLPPEGHA
ncbi:MAG TPA: hypothetical protein VKT22_01915 [Steroidobacteraceae bacterium]|nr:hypothetical protein [Steroidobacteraceae bacterium]